MVRAAVAISPVEDAWDGVVAAVARHLMSGGDRGKHATAYGLDHRVVAALRSVPPASLNDGNFGEVLSDWATARGAFFNSLATSSIFVAMLDSMRKVPLAQRLGSVQVGATAVVLAEGNVAPISQLMMAGVTLIPRKAVALIILSREVASLTTPEANDLVNAELRIAVSRAIDQKFLALVSSGITPFVSGGSAAMNADLKLLLDATNTPGALYWAMSPDVGNSAAVLDPAHLMSPTGGRLLGLPALVSDAIAPGMIYLLNASAIAANMDQMGMEASEQADIVMEQSPDSPKTASTVSVSLWQMNLVGLRAVLRFGAYRFVANGVGVMNGITWGSGDGS